MLRDGWADAKEGIFREGATDRIYRLTNTSRRHLEHEVASIEKMLAGISLVPATAKAFADSSGCQSPPCQPAQKEGAMTKPMLCRPLAPSAV